jgi:hypothetical protein
MRQYTRIATHKPPPKKRLVRPMAKMSQRLARHTSFKAMGK